MITPLQAVPDVAAGSGLTRLRSGVAASFNRYVCGAAVSRAASRGGAAPSGLPATWTVGVRKAKPEAVDFTTFAN